MIRNPYDLRAGLAEVLRQRKTRIEEKMESLEQSLLLLEQLGKGHVAEEARERIKNGTTDSD